MSNTAMASFCVKFILCLLCCGDAAFGQGIQFPGSSPPAQDEDRTVVASQVSCRVSSADGDLVPCVFPFVFGGFEFNGCITVSDPEGKPWCSTKVNGDGVHVGGNGHWGHCDPKVCPVSDDPEATEQGDGDEEGEGGVRSGGQLDDFKDCTTKGGRKGQCKPPSLCIGLTDADEDDNACQLEEDNAASLGVCCLERLEKDQGKISFAAEEADDEKDAKEKEAEVSNVSLQDVDKLVGERFGPSEGDEDLRGDSAPVFPGSGENEEEEEEEDELEAASAFHLRFNAPSEAAVEVDQRANDLLHAASEIQDEKQLSSDQAGIGLRMFNADSSKSIKELCPWIPGPSCNRKDMYRRSDGSCNNMRRANYGRAATPYQRILLPDYTDGSIDRPRQSRVRGGELPSARAVSNSGLTRSSNSVDSLHTTLVMQMGQFVDHDITHTPNHAASCCGRRGTFPSSFDKDECFPIRIPSNDPFWRGRKRCMNFARSLASPGLKCGLQFRQQMNQITHWLDSSNVYGSSQAMTDRLRRGFGGQLKVTRQSGSKEGSLPSCSAQRSSERRGMCSGCSSCYLAGDVRANEQLNLIVMHTVWMREHNRVARNLQKLNPSWDDDKLFQEARRITNAEYQHVVYKEWLPLILGNKFMTAFGLWPLSKGYSNQYRDDFDPRITNEFATAAFRFGHSLIPKHFNRIQRTSSGNGFTTKMNLRDIFFRPSELKKKVGLFDDLVRGLTSQSGERWDNAFVSDITDHLFEAGSGSGGLDLVALNVQRGRDHGLPGYNAYRQICRVGSGRARRFSDFEDLIDADQVSELSRVYEHVDDVDLFVGGFLEKAQDDALLGPTFKCIVGDQFARLKLGDRFFYDLGQDSNTRFSSSQLKEIRKTSMARILCDNTDTITSIQPQAFKVPGSSRSNRLQSCNSINIPSVNFAPFKERRKRTAGGSVVLNDESRR